MSVLSITFALLVSFSLGVELVEIISDDLIKDANEVSGYELESTFEWGNRSRHSFMIPKVNTIKDLL